MTHLLRGLVLFRSLLKLFGETIFDHCILLLCPPVSDLWQVRLPEMIVEIFTISLIGREEGEQVFDATSFQRRGKVVYTLIR